VAIHRTRLWDAERRASIANLKARDEVNAVAFSPDGKLTAGPWLPGASATGFGI
jgi:WD40 repeat protein